MVSHRVKGAALGGYASCVYAISIANERSIQRKGVLIAEPLRMNVSFLTATEIYTDTEFRRAFRMSRLVFQDLLNVVKQDLQKNVEMGRRSKRTTVPQDIRLAITLRVLAGGDLWDLLAVFHVKMSTIRRALNDTISFLNKCLRLPGLPRTLEGLHRASLAFKRLVVLRAHSMDL